MKFGCPKPGCSGLVSFGDRECPNCGQTFGPFTLIRLGWRRFALWLTRITALQCPVCHRPSPLRAAACRYCGQPMTIAVAAEVALTPLRARYQEVVDRLGPRGMRRLQWGYFLLSLALLWWLLGYTETHHAKDWVGNALLSVLYLAVFGLLAAVLTSRPDWVSFVRRTSRLTKLAVVVNSLTVLLLVQNLIGVWKQRAQILAGLFVVFYLAAWALCRLLWPQYLRAASIIVGASPPFNATDPQGRDVQSE